MDVERVPAKKPRKAEGEAAIAAAEATAKAARLAAARAAREKKTRKMEEEFLKIIAKPLSDEEVRQREEANEKFISESWERLRDNWPFEELIPFEAITEIPCMCFTDADLQHPRYKSVLTRRDSMQIVSVQVKALTEGLQWPLDVYGFIAVRDVLDRKRIMIFNRERKDCQTIKKQDSYLRLTGPTRGVVINNDASYLEFVLKVKGLTESEDKDLSKFATTYRLGTGFTHPIEYTSKLCSLEMQHYTVRLSVQATISVRVSEGKWPHGFRGVLTACTAAKRDIQISLLDLNDDELPVDFDGFIKLSRRVVCVEDDGRLGVALFENGFGDLGAIWFAAEKSRRITHHMRVKKFSLWLEVTVAWSLF